MTSKDELRLQVGQKLHDYGVKGQDNDYLTNFILNLLEGEKQKAFIFGQRVGQYQAADKMYGIIPTLWLFKDSNDLSVMKMNVERTDDLLKECEKYLNHNAKTYGQYLATLNKEPNKGEDV